MRIPDQLHCIIANKQYIEKAVIQDDKEIFFLELHGEIDIVYLTSNIAILYNEDSYSLGLPKNLLGIYGKAIICKHIEGKLISLTAEEQDAILKIIKDAALTGEEV